MQSSYCLHRCLRPDFKIEVTSFSSTVEGKILSAIPELKKINNPVRLSIYLSSTYFCSLFCKEKFKTLEREKGLLDIYSAECQSPRRVCSYRDVNRCLSLGCYLTSRKWMVMQSSAIDSCSWQCK